MSHVRTRPVRSAADRRAYLSLARAPYVDNPYWIQPDVRILKGLLRGKSCLALRSDWQALLAEEDGEGVACLTAFLNPSFEETHGEKIGTIGFFEALPGHEMAVDTLFQEAEGWLTSRSAARVWGPMNGHMLYGFGCLESHYAERPTIGSPYNPPEYPGHWWRQSYRQARSFYSYRVDLQSERTRAAIDRALDTSRLEREPVIHHRQADLNAWQREIGILCDLYNSGFSHQWGHATLRRDEVWELLGPLRFAADRELFWIAEMDGKAVGLVLCMPDIGEVLARGVASQTWRALLTLLGHRNSRRGGVLVLGVLPQAQGRGLGRTLLAHALKRMVARGMIEAEYCFVLESDFASQHVVQGLGGVQGKRYLMFEKTLS